MTTPTLESQAEQLVLPLDPAAGLDAVFRRVFRRLGLKRAAPEFRVEYRPFASLRSSIHLRGDGAIVHLADVLAGAPPLVNEALAEILLAQLFRRRPSREARACYLAYVYRPAVRQRIDEARRRRGRKRLLPPRGRNYDLEKIFDRLNRRFFAGELARPRLGWSTRRSRCILGHYDSAHGAIIISRWFDSADVPRFLIEYLVFHEMLHIKYPVERDGHRRVVHSRAFRDAERQFPHYERARRRLKRASL
ncbi:MAG: M48 family peptidase [Acidobacteriia bacterium]|nr:M48 family peptidase [Terriglobia bacterium]